LAIAAEPQLQENVVFLSVSWETYEAILADLGDDSHTRLAYDGQTLELMSPLRGHEGDVRLLDALLVLVMEEWDINLHCIGSMTLKAKPVGAEPDTSYYIAHADDVGGLREIDLRTSPPPDLVVEFDLSRQRMDKFEIYARLGVPEFWRYGRGGLQAFTLRAGEYHEIAASEVIPGLPMAALASFLERRLEPDRRPLLKDWRGWLRANQHAVRRGSSPA
jgi:Uma2 family endonuclease